MQFCEGLQKGGSCWFLLHIYIYNSFETKSNLRDWSSDLLLCSLACISLPGKFCLLNAQYEHDQTCMSVTDSVKLRLHSVSSGPCRSTGAQVHALSALPWWQMQIAHCQNRKTFKTNRKASIVLWKFLGSSGQNPSQIEVSGTRWTYWPARLFALSCCTSLEGCLIPTMLPRLLESCPDCFPKSPVICVTISSTASGIFGPTNFAWSTLLATVWTLRRNQKVPHFGGQSKLLTFYGGTQ